MGSGFKVTGRMDERVTELSADLSHFLQAFSTASKFSGPSLHFHLRTHECLCRHGSAVNAIASEDFYECLYATLASWGMHRMGRGNTKLRELSVIKQSVRAQERAIEALQHFCLCDISAAEIHPLIKKIWQLLNSLSVSIAEAKIVANSKVLHHVLPNLIPPIDRTYTFNFFYNRNSLSIGEEDAFSEMFFRFHRMASGQKDKLTAHLDHGWNSSLTKVLDNALVGYVVDFLRVQED
jgi:hypothetical protein